jgi:Na+-translocating ferredoxin:NAD+ oxidoreductase RnfD subunit
MSLKSNLSNEEPPHLHSGFTKDQLMKRTFAALLIPSALAVYAIGLTALYHLSAAVITGLGIHYMVHFAESSRKRNPSYPSPSSHLVAALIAGLTMPASSPILITILVAALTTFVFKDGQGYFFNRKYLNPAGAAKALLLTLISVLVFLPDPLRSGMILHPHHLRLDLFSADAFSASVNRLYTRDTLTSFQSLLFWKTHGWMGGVSGVTVLLTGVVLTIWAKLKWRIVFSFLLTMTVLSAAAGVLTGGYVLLRIAFHVFTGSVIFFAFFMATEPQTTPMTYIGQILFGIILGIVTFILHLLNVLGGSVYALIFLNLLVDRLDRIQFRKPYFKGGN